MTSYQYPNLGGFSGPGNNPPTAYSKRGRDADKFQNFTFECDSNLPFSGIIYLQGSLDFPPQHSGIRSKASMVDDTTWFDVAKIEINNEGGIFFLETEIELSLVRAVCRTGDYWSAAYGVDGNAIGTAGEFTINGLGPIAVDPGNTATDVAALINSNADIISDGTIVASTVGDLNNRLRIIKNNGADLVLTDTLNTPLVDLGVTPGTYVSGRILRIKSMR